MEKNRRERERKNKNGRGEDCPWITTIERRVSFFPLFRTISSFYIGFPFISTLPKRAAEISYPIRILTSVEGVLKHSLIRSCRRTFEKVSCPSGVHGSLAKLSLFNILL